MVLQYTCPNCASDMQFDSESGMLSCKYCGRKDNIEHFSEDLISKNFAPNETKEYLCNNCGGVVITDADTTATTCCFCDSSVVLQDRLSGTLMPAKVIPFAINKEKAEEAFRKWTKKGKLAPNSFKEANRIKEITGIYVPFWMYDLNGRMAVNVEATKVRAYTQGDYIYTETKHYDVYRDVTIDFLKVPVDASEMMDDKIMDLLEPYDYRDLKEFKTPYLAGYLAEKYNYDDQELFTRVKQKVRSAIHSYVGSTITGYASVNYRQKQEKIKNKQSEYALFPVWMVYYDHEKTEHIFAMNGQTGKIIGRPPVSKTKVATWVGGITAASFIIARLITVMVGGDIL